jgi:uncharacterized protein
MVDADLATWEPDIELAIEKLRDIVGTARMTLIGLRLGATLAARVAASEGGRYSGAVGPDPVWAGLSGEPGRRRGTGRLWPSGDFR